jgi:hypothetical protein
MAPAEVTFVGSKAPAAATRAMIWVHGQLFLLLKKGTPSSRTPRTVPAARVR